MRNKHEWCTLPSTNNDWIMLHLECTNICPTVKKKTLLKKWGNEVMTTWHTCTCAPKVLDLPYLSWYPSWCEVSYSLNTAKTTGFFNCKQWQGIINLVQYGAGLWESLLLSANVVTTMTWSWILLTCNQHQTFSSWGTQLADYKMEASAPPSMAWKKND